MQEIILKNALPWSNPSIKILQAGIYRWDHSENLTISMSTWTKSKNYYKITIGFIRQKKDSQYFLYSEQMKPGNKVNLNSH